MSRFNTNSPGTKTVNLAGGEAHSTTPQLALVSLLVTSFAQDQFYRSAKQTFDELKKLIMQNDPLFVAQALIYARHTFGMRSITHVGASLLAKWTAGFPWGKEFYARIAKRPDDLTEIVSYHFSQKEKLTKAMKKGFSKALTGFDAYQLAKYRGEGKTVKLVDVVNLVHPVGGGPEMPISKLMRGELTLSENDTWESALSAAGSDAKAKQTAWGTLLVSGKIGYLALLRNLRNIVEQAPIFAPDAAEMLMDAARIKKATVFPFQFQTAIEQLLMLGTAPGRIMAVAAAKALEISVANVPVFTGDTLVVLDTSNSMQGKDGKPMKIGALFAAVLAKSNGADVMTFDGDARYQSYNPGDTVGTIASSFRFDGGSTSFNSIFLRANKPYDRIIILSDMQGWDGFYTPAAAFANYKARTNCNPIIYSFDLAGYGSLQFPERNIFALAGFSEKIFDIMGLLEKDKAALVNAVKNVQL